MPLRPGTWLIAALVSALVGCAGPEMAARDSPFVGRRSAPLATLEGQGCAPETVVVLCAGDGCRFHWCSAVAPSLASLRQLHNPDGTWVPLPGAIEMRPALRTGRIPSGMFLTRGVGGSFGSASARASPGQAQDSAQDGDVIERILLLRKPGDVARWWAAAPRTEPERWTHPLSQWERKYIDSMSAPSVPEPVRLWPPVSPERLSPQQLQEAERLFGRGPTVAQEYCNWENRRRLVGHYVMTHPATLRLSLGLYGLARDSSPLSFALERGWQVASGKEMFTGQDVSRLGAAAEFFTALAAGAATGKLMKAARPAPVEGVRPPSAPVHSGLATEGQPADALGEVIPLSRARVPPAPAQEEPSLAATGTDGRSAPSRKAGPGKRATRSRVQPPDGAGELPARPKAAREPSNPSAAGEEAGGLDALVDTELGDTPEVLRAKVRAEEATARGGRLPRNLAAVRRAKPALERPRPGVAPDSARWREYVAYYEERLAEMEAANEAGTLDSVEPPLDWSPYENMRDNFARGLKYQRARTAALRQLAELRGFSKPHIQSNAGVLKADLRYADVLIIETDPSKPLRVETYSFKSRDFRGMKPREAQPLIEADARSAMKHYGGEVDLRTPGLGMRGKPVKVDTVHLRYDAEFQPVEKEARQALQAVMKAIADELGVEVRFE